MPEIRVHESVTPAAQHAWLVAGLESGRVDNRAHYLSERASGRWRDLAAAHSPTADECDGLRAYDEAARSVIAELAGRVSTVHVVGVACGNGVKEQRLLGALRGAGVPHLVATPVDVSIPLVGIAAGAMAAVPGVAVTHAVAVDISVTPDLSPLVDRRPGMRVVTLFGAIATLGSGAIGPAVSLLAPGDLLIVSGNLLPGRPGARGDVIAQYDNAATRHWLQAVQDDIDMTAAGDIVFRWDDTGDALGIVGEITPQHSVVANVGDVTVTLLAGAPVRVFVSYRHTPDDLRVTLAEQGLRVVHMAISPSGEEGVVVATPA
ncbi:MAG: hypothetical protein EXQ74_04825 [Thermoleophilia bacterium]|nr:hypothetical protein [Thermoleophilia bacterium]